MPSCLRAFQVERAHIEVYPSKVEASHAAAALAASRLRDALAERNKARVIVATGNSQQDLIAALVKIPGVTWGDVEVFHMDEYVGIPATHSASFRRWVKERLVDHVHPGRVHYLNGDAPDLAAECRRYGDLLYSDVVDVCLLGIGENGHIAFNDPHVADFHDPVAIKRVDLDERSRKQQVGEGHFANLDAVPRDALSLTIPALMKAEHLVCCVPERRKAEAVRNALEAPISLACPASVVRTHNQACIFLDIESASMLTNPEPVAPTGQ